MWFKNLVVYRLPPDCVLDAADLGQKLSRTPLQPCGGFDMESRGWIAPRGNDAFIRSVNRQWLLTLGIDQKLLPAAVIRQVTQERADKIAELQPYPVGRKQMRDLKQQVITELMPKAFTRRQTVSAWIDPVNRWLVVDAAGENKAEALVEMLRKSLDNLPLKRLETQHSPGAAMTSWLASGNAPGGFTIDQDLELRSTDENKAMVRYVRHDLHGREIQQHIAAGKRATRLGMTWGSRISFMLTEQLQIKRIVFLDILKNEAESQSASSDGDADEQFDVNFALMSGELAHLLADLTAALGAEAADTNPAGMKNAPASAMAAR
ncbi:MAG: recombination-associated protein RdgC [Pseudomonadota bacterium]